MDCLFLCIFICTEFWRTLRTLLHFFLHLPPYHHGSDTAHSFLTQRIQGSFFVTINGVSKYSSGLWVKRWPLSTSVVNSHRRHLSPLSSISICGPKISNNWQDLVYKSDFIYFLFNLWKDGWACNLCNHVSRFPIRQTPERRRTRLRDDLSNNAAATKSALRSSLVRESSKSIKFGIILSSFLQGGLCASGLHSYHSFEGTDDSTVRAQG